MAKKDNNGVKRANDILPDANSEASGGSGQFAENKSSRVLRLLLNCVLRRDRDSNSSDGYPSTRPPNGRIRPLCHLSPFAAAKV